MKEKYTVEDKKMLEEISDIEKWADEMLKSMLENGITYMNIGRV